MAATAQEGTTNPLKAATRWQAVRAQLRPASGGASTSTAASKGFDVSPISTIKCKATVLDDGYEDDWSPNRKKMGVFMHSKKFDIWRGTVILLNIALLVFETDAEASELGAPEWITAANYWFIFAYSLEISARVAIYRWQFFEEWANWVDITIVSTDVIVESLFLTVDNVGGNPSLVVLRMFRLARLGRTHKALTMFPELNIMVLGLRGAMRAMMWGMVLLVFIVMCFGILAVQVIHPLNKEVAALGVYDGCERCPRAFESVAAAALTFTQQVVAGDSWGQVSIPIIERYPVTILFFMLVLNTMGMVLLNLILAVVIDSANQGRQETDHARAELKENNFQEASAVLKVFCEAIDTDHSGTLTLQEIISGYQDSMAFQDSMRILDIDEKDMHTVFKIMDEDHSGTIIYDEFVDQLYKMKTESQHTMITFIKFYVQEIQREMREELRNTRHLLIDFHDGLKPLLRELPVVSPTKTACSNNGLANKQPHPTFKPAAPNLAGVQSSHDEMGRLLKNLAEEIQNHASITGSWGPSCVAGETPSPLLAAESQKHAGRVDLLGSSPLVGESPITPFAEKASAVPKPAQANSGAPLIETGRPSVGASICPADALVAETAPQLLTSPPHPEGFSTSMATVACI